MRIVTWMILALVFALGALFGTLTAHAATTTVATTVKLTGTTLPESATVGLTLPAAPDSDVILTLTVADPDFANEGELTVNGYGPVTLFAAGFGYVPQGTACDSGKVATCDVRLVTPRGWWFGPQQENVLRFTHTATSGYEVRSISAEFTPVASGGAGGGTVGSPPPAVPPAVIPDPPPTPLQALLFGSRVPRWYVLADLVRLEQRTIGKTWFTYVCWSGIDQGTRRYAVSKVQRSKLDSALRASGPLQPLPATTLTCLEESTICWNGDTTKCTTD